MNGIIIQKYVATSKTGGTESSLGKNNSDTVVERNLLIGQVRATLKMRGNP